MASVLCRSDHVARCTACGHLVAHTVVRGLVYATGLLLLIGMLEAFLRRSPNLRAAANRYWHATRPVAKVTM